MAAAITLQDATHFQVTRAFTVSPGVPRPIAGMRFSADGATLYVVGAADTNSSALYRMAVTRNAAQQVTALGSPVKVFNGVNPDSGNEPDAGLDAGLEFGPAGTFFYSYFPTNFIGERPGGVAGTEKTTSLPALVSVAGVTFAAARTDPGTGFGYMNVSTGVTGFIYEVPLVASTPAGTYVPNPSAPIALLAKAFQSGPPRVGGQGVTGLQYVPAGTFAGDLMYASFADKELWSIRMSDATGLPVGGVSTPVEDLFATGFNAPPIGLEFDPITANELFVSTFDAALDGNNQILQIAGFASTAPTTTTTAVSTTSTTSSSTSSSTSTSKPTTTSTTSTTSSSTSPSTSTSKPSTTSTVPATTSSTSTSTSKPTTTSTSSTTSSSTSPSTSTSKPTTTSTSSTTTSTSKPPTTSTSVTGTSTSMTTTTIPAAVLVRTSSLTMRDRTGPPASPARRRLTFRASTSGDGAAHAVVVPARGSAADPTLDGAVLDVYNATGSGERVTIALPSAGWVAYGDASTPAGYRWTAPSRSDPVGRVIVRANRIRIRAGGVSWAYTLDEGAQGAVALRLRLGTGTAWCASVPAKTSGTPPTSAAYDHQDRFVGARNVLPAACPPLP